MDTLRDNNTTILLGVVGPMGASMACGEVRACGVETQPVFGARLRGMHVTAAKRRIMPDQLVRDGRRYCRERRGLRQEEVILASSYVDVEHEVQCLEGLLI